MDGPSSVDDSNAYEEMNEAGRRGSILGRMNQRFQDALQTGRGDERMRDVTEETDNDPNVTADDIAMKRAKSVRPQRMVVPEGVIIEGALTSGSETEIEGKVDGDVTVDGILILGKSALISGNVRAVACRLAGLVEGQMDCSQELEVTASGRLNADAMAGRSMVLAGQINGNVTCGGELRLCPNSEVNGNIRARVFVLEEGATFNGECSIGSTAKPSAQKKEKPAEAAKK